MSEAGADVPEGGGAAGCTGESDGADGVIQEGGSAVGCAGGEGCCTVTMLESSRGLFLT